MAPVARRSALEDRVGRHFLCQGVGVAMDQLACAIFLSEQVCHTQLMQSRLVLADNERLAALDGHGIGQIAAGAASKVLDCKLGAAARYRVERCMVFAGHQADDTRSLHSPVRTVLETRDISRPQSERR
jgi:hypothetical protein